MHKTGLHTILIAVILQVDFKAHLLMTKQRTLFFNITNQHCFELLPESICCANY